MAQWEAEYRMDVNGEGYPQIGETLENPPPGIPTGFCHKARGCAAGALPRVPAQHINNPKGVVPRQHPCRPAPGWPDRAEWTMPSWIFNIATSPEQGDPPFRCLGTTTLWLLRSSQAHPG